VKKSTLRYFGQKLISAIEMIHKIITANLIDKIFLLIQTQTEFKRESIWYEIQDDWSFIYLRISVETMDTKKCWH